MAQSYVRVRKNAKTAQSPLYSKAIKEFVQKMGGPWAVINAISREMERDNTLFDNTPTRMPQHVSSIQEPDEEDQILARHGDVELPIGRAM